jgi:hypothetical protein
MQGNHLFKFNFLDSPCVNFNSFYNNYVPTSIEKCNFWVVYFEIFFIFLKKFYLNLCYPLRGLSAI